MYSGGDSNPPCFARATTKSCIEVEHLTVNASVFFPSISDISSRLSGAAAFGVNLAQLVGNRRARIGDAPAIEVRDARLRNSDQNGQLGLGHPRIIKDVCYE